MKKILFFIATTLVSFVSCTRELEFRQTSSDIACNVSAIMPEFKSGGDIADTKASLESVVRINWSAGDKLAIINLTTGKQLGGCLVADNNGSKTSFSPSNLVGTISAGDKLVFWYNPSDDNIIEQEQQYSPIIVDLTEQNGGQNDVPIVGYALYTAAADNEIRAENIAFTFLVSYMQLALSALPASTSITAMEVSDVNSKGEFRIDDGNFVFEKTKGKVKLIDPFTANSKGANVRYFSMFQSEAEVSARVATITANGQEYQTTWIKSAINNGNYYQSVATGFANEFIQFADDAFKAYCVSHYDGNGDGEISFAEAAAVTSYESFTNNEKSSIKAIYELPYFPSKIGIPSFEGFSALERINLPGTLTEIPENEFKGCSSLVSIVIPDGVENIGEGAFEGCIQLEAFNSNLATEDGQYLVRDGHLLAFAPASHFYITIPNGVDVINKGVFKNCSTIKSLLLSSTSEIGASAFEGCSSLATINLTESMVNIGDRAFYNCTNLFSVLSQSTTPPTIGSDVFGNCSSDLKIFVSENSKDAYDNSNWNEYDVRSSTWNKLFYTTTDEQIITPIYPELGTNVTLLSNEYVDGRGVMTFSGNIIGFDNTNEYYAKWLSGTPFQTRPAYYESMFTHQDRLVSVIIPDCARSIPSFEGCSNLQSIYVPESVTERWDIVKTCLNDCSKLQKFSGKYASDDGYFLIRDGIVELAAKQCPSEIIIPTDVRCISESAFTNCKNLLRITITENIKEIGLQAFRECPIVEYRFVSTNPPALTGDYWTFWFGDGGLIYVPYSAVDTYKTASDNWHYIADKIVGY